MVSPLMINYDRESLIFELIKVINNKNICIVKIKQEVVGRGKKFISNIFVMVGNELITTNYADTRQLITELKLFERGNKQNTFTKIEKFDGNINLKLQLYNSSIYVFKSEAETIVQVYFDLIRGINMEALADNEFKFTPDILTKLLGCTGTLGWVNT
jgi:hypothetical protein